MSARPILRMTALLLFLAVLLPISPRAADNLSAFGFHQRPGAQVPLDTPLHDAAGHDVRLAELTHGQPVILVLGYYHCPNLCGVVRDDVFNALQHSGIARGAYSLIAVSIDPAERPADAAAAKREDMARFAIAGADHDWHYLTGSAASIAAVADAVGFRDRYDAQLKQYLHPAGLVFLAPNGRVSGYLMGVGYTPGDLALGVSRARNGGVAPVASQVLLLCFHFDPSTGRYTLAIARVLQLAGLLTVLTLGGTIALAIRREHRR